MTITIREPKIEADFVSLSDLAHQLAAYHQEHLRPDPVKLQTDTSWYSARIISVDGVDVGFVSWHTVYACQSAERAIELQNIFVDQKYRNRRLGIQLVLEVIQDALKLNCAEIKIGLRKDNRLALKFYKKLGCSITDRNDSWRCKLKRQQMVEIISQVANKAK